MTWNNDDYFAALKKPVLVVGAGGIGCELLKNLVLSGFSKIHVIDLDTIDISNLNRQFLFRKEHVGKSKAEVASAAVKAMKPNIDISFDHGSIISDKYNVDFFKSFSLVFNALDNLTARAHVNRLCLNADIPLFESGSAGYKGNVFPIIKGKTECFECLEKPKQTTFPGCTIRNTPSELIHCVVWAKAVFNQLFGEADADEEVSPDDSRITENESGFERKNEENGVSNGNGIDKKVLGKSVRILASESDYNPETIFDKLFDQDVKYLLGLASLWKDRRSPKPMKWQDFSAAGADGVNEIYPVETWIGIFTKTVQELGKSFKSVETQGNVLFWDKDDEVAMNFVAAVANIRAHIFHIPMKSIFEIKSMAGNIIPAIATTNAMVAGMVVVEAIRMLRSGEITNLRTVYTSNKTIAGRLLSSSAANSPNPKCFVCGGDKKTATVTVNTELMKLITFKERVLKHGLNVVEPDVMGAVDMKLFISADDDVDPTLRLVDISPRISP
uniref:SUMO-activating enzyme subunit n=1 Tax=Panagrolaimus sp. JU765 TaxID=591449 RepID=A0AC34QPJ1_9BILA